MVLTEVNAQAATPVAAFAGAKASFAPIPAHVESAISELMDLITSLPALEMLVSTDGLTGNLWRASASDIESADVVYCLEETDSATLARIASLLTTWNEYAAGVDGNGNGTGASEAPLLWAALSEAGLESKALPVLMQLAMDAKNADRIHRSLLAANVATLYAAHPGASAYGLFNEWIVRDVLSVLRTAVGLVAADFAASGGTKGASKSSKGRKRSSKRSSGAATASSKRARRSAAPSSFGDDGAGDDGDDNDRDGNAFTIDDVRVATDALLDNLATLLCRVGLVGCPDAHTRAVEVCASAFSSGLTGSTAALMGALLRPIHGAEDAIVLTVFRYLLPSMSLAVSGGGGPGSATVPRPAEDARAAATAFVASSLASAAGGDGSVMPGAYQTAAHTLLQHMTVRTPDRAAYRTAVRKSIFGVLLALPADQWPRYVAFLVKCTQNPKAGIRVAAVEIAGQLLATPEVISGGEATGPALLRAVVRRSSDKAPTVRTKVLSCVGAAVDAFNADPKSVLALVFASTLGGGDLQEAFSALLAIVNDRMNDDKAAVRKAALKAFESLSAAMDVVPTASGDIVELLHERCMDQSLSIRKQAMTTMTEMLLSKSTAATPDASLAGAWLAAILPMVLDPESAVQDKCVSLVNDVLFHNFADGYPSFAVGVLETMDGDMRKYLQRIVAVASRRSMIDSAVFDGVQMAVFGTWSHCLPVWHLYGLLVASFEDLADVHEMMTARRQLVDSGAEGCAEVEVAMLTAINAMSREGIGAEARDELLAVLEDRLFGFGASSAFVVVAVQLMGKLSDDRPGWTGRLFERIGAALGSAIAAGEGAIDAAFVPHVFSIGEVAQLDVPVPALLVTYLQAIVAQDGSLALGLDGGFGSEVEDGRGGGALDESLGAAGDRSGTGIAVAPVLRAHAFVALGKCCLYDEHLAVSMVPAFVRELATGEPSIRNNVMVIMCDLCIRYTSVVDRYVPNLALRIVDPNPLIRRQTLTLLTRLLQEDYVKWKGSLFFRFVLGLVDSEESIRDFTEYCLVNVLLARYPTLFFAKFVETVFALNNTTAHPAFNQHPQTAEERQVFALLGDRNAGARRAIYGTLLKYMSDEEKFQITAKLCSDVLGAVVDGVLPLDDGAAVVKDTLAILSSGDIKLSPAALKGSDLDDSLNDSLDSSVASAAGGNGAAGRRGGALAAARTKLLTKIMKKNTIENIVPIVIALKRQLEASHSPLLRDLMSYVTVLLSDFDSEVSDILVSDRQLAAEIAYDVRKYEEELAAAEGLTDGPGAAMSDSMVAVTPGVRTKRRTARDVIAGLATPTAASTPLPNRPALTPQALGGNFSVPTLRINRRREAGAPGMSGGHARATPSRVAQTAPRGTTGRPRMVMDDVVEPKRLFGAGGSTSDDDNEANDGTEAIAPVSSAAVAAVAEGEAEDAAKAMRIVMPSPSGARKAPERMWNVTPLRRQAAERAIAKRGVDKKRGISERQEEDADLPAADASAAAVASPVRRSKRLSTAVVDDDDDDDDSISGGGEASDSNAPQPRRSARIFKLS